MTLAVTLDRAAGTFRLAGVHWSGVEPLDQLPRVLAFYRDLKARGDKGKDRRVWGHCYAGTVAALEAAVRELANG
jgi:pyruvate formate-lyase activating enzyme-like uncharacterized protein